MFLILAGMSVGALVVLHVFFREKSKWFVPGYDNMIDKPSVPEDARNVGIN